jgi:GAF domain-containing protein
LTHGHHAPRTEDAQRLRGLLEAHRRITDDLSLTSVLDRIVSTACDLVGAEYGALAVIGPDGSLEHFVSRGMGDVLAGQIANLPHGDGPAAGLPSEIGSLLGAPIRVHGRILGELYLADEGPEPFCVEDEELLVALAATAGTAIENARLYDDAQRNRDWLRASGEIARDLLRDADDDVLSQLLERAFRVADADYAGLILPTDSDQLRVTAALGIGAEDVGGVVFDPASSALGKAILAAESGRTHDVTLWARVDFDNPHGFGPAMLVPVVAQGGSGGMLMVRLAGRPSFTQRDVELAAGFAAQVALAMQFNEARAEAEQMRALECNDRLARDLHDNVMQRLFATGVGLQALVGQLPETESRERLRQHIADLDDTLHQIRTTLADLRGWTGPPQ